MKSIITLLAFVLTFTATGADKNNPVVFPDSKYPTFVSKGETIVLDDVGLKVELPCLFDRYRKKFFLSYENSKMQKFYFLKWNYFFQFQSIKNST